MKSTLNGESEKQRKLGSKRKEERPAAVNVKNREKRKDLLL